MTWKKSPPELVERFNAALPIDDRVERRTMFGYPCAFAGGNMFGGLHEYRCFVRLGEVQRRRLLDLPGTSPFEPIAGRRMTEYVAMPDSFSRADLAKWLALGLRYAASLPPKPRQPRRARR
jgi:TfoX/Sxy family transcriptional regulator of competence genes